MDIYAHWARSENAGDRVTPWLINAAGHQPMWVPTDVQHRHLVGAGSIANHAGPNASVWGAGIATATDPIEPTAKFISVRGPLTRKRVLDCGGSCPEVYGDPGLLVSAYYQPPRTITHAVGIVPHVVDYLEAVKWWGHVEGVKVIRMLDTIENVIDEILSCARIVSTSLHGIVFAHAYGREAAWATMGNRVGGDGTKFRDHYLSLGMVPPERPSSLYAEQLTFDNLPFTAPTSNQLARTTLGVQNARPF